MGICSLVLHTWCTFNKTRCFFSCMAGMQMSTIVFQNSMDGTNLCSKCSKFWFIHMRMHTRCTIYRNLLTMYDYWSYNLGVIVYIYSLSPFPVNLSHICILINYQHDHLDSYHLPLEMLASSRNCIHIHVCVMFVQQLIKKLRPKNYDYLVMFHLDIYHVYMYMTCTCILLVVHVNNVLFAMICFQWFGLRFPKATIYLDTARECYEAYVIYNFMSYLLNYLHSEYVDLETTIGAKPQVNHLVPFCCFPAWKMGR